MVKIFFLLFIFFIINNCSLNTKKLTFKKNNFNEKKDISELKFDYDLSFENFKKNAIEYGKLSDYPKLDK